MHSRYVFVLFLISVFALSFAVPAVDLTETAYDESEPLPLACASIFSITLARSMDYMARVRKPDLGTWIGWQKKSVPGLAAKEAILGNSHSRLSSLPVTSLRC